MDDDRTPNPDLAPSPDAPAAAPDPEAIARAYAEGWDAFRAAFDRLVGDNLARADGLFRQALDTPTETDRAAAREAAQGRADLEARLVAERSDHAAALAAERARHRAALETLREEIAAGCLAAEQVARHLPGLLSGLGRLAQRVAAELDEVQEAPSGDATPAPAPAAGEYRERKEEGLLVAPPDPPKPPDPADHPSPPADPAGSLVASRAELDAELRELSAALEKRPAQRRDNPPVDPKGRRGAQWLAVARAAEPAE